MNLGMLLSLEQIYLSKGKEQSALKTDDEIIEYLKETKDFSEYQINSGFTFYRFADETFTTDQWQEVDYLFGILDKARAEQNVDAMINVIGTVLWDMGNLFGTNHPDFAQ